MKYRAYIAVDDIEINNRYGKTLMKMKREPYTLDLTLGKCDRSTTVVQYKMARKYIEMLVKN